MSLFGKKSSDRFITKVQSELTNPKPIPAVPPINMGELFLLTCLGHGQDIAVDEDEFQFTRQTMLRDVIEMMKCLKLLGVKRGDIVLTQISRPTYIAVVLEFAVNLIGGVSCYRDNAFGEESFRDILRKFKPAVTFLVDKDEEWVNDLRRHVPGLGHVGRIEKLTDQPVSDLNALDTVKIGPATAAEIAAEYRGLPPFTRSGFDDLALILFSSGSTDAPKPLEYSNRSITSLAIYSKEAAGVKIWDPEVKSYMSIVSPQSSYGNEVSTLCPLLGGATAILAPNLSAETLEYYLSKKPNVIFGVPRILEQIPLVLPDDYDISFLKMIATGGESYPAAESLKLRKWLDEHGGENAKICNGLGAGEIGGLFSTSVGNIDYDPNSVGIIPAGVIPAVVDPDSLEELGCGEVGLMYGSGDHCMTGYRGLPKLEHDQTLYIKGHRFINVGVIGSIDQSGRVYIVDRDNHFLNDLRLKVYFAHVTAALAQSPLVKESYVTKGAHAEYGLAPYAFVVLQDGVEPSEETRQQILETVQQPFPYGSESYTLTKYEVPYRLEFLETLPMNDKEKIDRNKLDQAAQNLGGDRLSLGSDEAVDTEQLEALAQHLGTDEQAAYEQRLSEIRSS